MPEPSAALMLKLIGREPVADQTMAFRFEKPGWAFKPGQSVDMTLIDPPETDAEGNTRSFSIASDQSEDALLFATRLRGSAFKRVLSQMPLGNAVKVDGPFGSLTLHNNAARAAVFLAGGIGITPFRGMVVRAAREKLAHHIYLFYSNHRPEDAVFLEELQSLQQQNSNYKLIATMTSMEKSKRAWQGETGFIDKAMLERNLQGAASPIYYTAGPASMVKAMQSLLHQIGVDDDDICVEEFPGY